MIGTKELYSFFCEKANFFYKFNHSALLHTNSLEFEGIQKNSLSKGVFKRSSRISLPCLWGHSYSTQNEWFCNYLILASEHCFDPCYHSFCAFFLDSLEISWIWYESEFHEESEDLYVSNRSESSESSCLIWSYTSSRESSDTSIFFLILYRLSSGPVICFSEKCRDSCSWRSSWIEVKLEICVKILRSVIHPFISPFDIESFWHLLDLESWDPSFYDLIHDLFCSVCLSDFSRDSPSILIFTGKVMPDCKCYIVHKNYMLGKYRSTASFGSGWVKIHSHLSFVISLTWYATTPGFSTQWTSFE